VGGRDTLESSKLRVIEHAVAEGNGVIVFVETVAACTAVQTKIITHLQQNKSMEENLVAVYNSTLLRGDKYATRKFFRR